MREKLAELAHEQWSGWMDYLFSKGTFNEDGTWTMPAWAVERWQRQAQTKYADLSPEEQESDRKEADKFVAVFLDIQPSTLEFIDEFDTGLRPRRPLPLL